MFKNFVNWESYRLSYRLWYSHYMGNTPTQNIIWTLTSSDRRLDEQKKILILKKCLEVNNCWFVKIQWSDWSTSISKSDWLLTILIILCIYCAIKIPVHFTNHKSIRIKEFNHSIKFVDKNILFKNQSFKGHSGSPQNICNFSDEPVSYIPPNFKAKSVCHFQCWKNTKKDKQVNKIKSFGIILL